MDFDWHEAKSRRNRSERGYGFDVAVRIFAGRTVEWRDTRQDYGETRVVAVGQVDQDFLTVVYTDRETVRWIISSWPASRKERKLWLARA